MSPKHSLDSPRSSGLRTHTLHHSPGSGIGRVRELHLFIEMALLLLGLHMTRAEGENLIFFFAEGEILFLVHFVKEMDFSGKLL